MRTITTAPIVFACLTFAACGGNSTTPGATCGAGTMLVNGQCVVVASAGSGGSGGTDMAGGASGTGGMANAADAGGDSSSVDSGAIPNSCPNPTPPPSSTFDDFEDGFLHGWYTA